MGKIFEHDYETVTAQCDNCGARCIYNRVDDIGEPGPYAGRDITCLVCGKLFWIYGDIANSADDLFIYSADEHLASKRYMLCVANLAQAWEIFFSTFAHSNYLYRPFFAGTAYERDIEQFNRLSVQLGDTINKFPFVRMRNLLINTLLQRLHPKALQDCEAAISRIVDEGFGNDPKKAAVEGFTDDNTRNLIVQLQSLRIGDLRNKVVHHAAYRPRREEVENCRHEISILYRAKGMLDVRDLEEWPQ